MPHGITQCFLPPGRGDIPALNCVCKGLDEPVDLVLMLQFLYYVSPDERKQLFGKLYERWLSAGGFVAIAQSSRTR